MIIKIKDYTTRGRTYEIWLEERGRFIVKGGIEGQEVTEYTLAAIEEKIEKVVAANRKRASVRFYWVRSGRVQEGVATGIRVDGRAVLAKVDGKAEQLQSYQMDNLLLGETPVEELEALLVEQARARDAVEAFEEKWKFVDLEKVVKEALEKA